MRAHLALGPLSLILLTGAIAPPKPPTIEGTYKLVSRDLPDGSKQVPPTIHGLLTYTKQYRNFNIYSKNAAGKATSISAIAAYQLSEKQYREQSIYYFVNDEIGGKGPHYDLSSPTATSPVSLKDDRIEIKLP